jgi:hypothetical protein
VSSNPPTTKIELGSLLAGLGAVLLLVSLFLDWYGPEEGGGGITAWQTFELVDLILAALSIAVLYALFERLTKLRDQPILPGWVATVAGPVAVVLVVVAIVNDPPILLTVPGTELEAGIWVALAGGLLISLGALLGRVRISLVMSAREGEDSVDRAAETQTMPAESEQPPSADASR